jgi:hypothetical protein
MTKERFRESTCALTTEAAGLAPSWRWGKLQLARLCKVRRPTSCSKDKGALVRGTSGGGGRGGRGVTNGAAVPTDDVELLPLLLLLLLLFPLTEDAFSLPTLLPVLLLVVAEALLGFAVGRGVGSSVVKGGALVKGLAVAGVFVKGAGVTA